LVQKLQTGPHISYILPYQGVDSPDKIRGPDKIKL